MLALRILKPDELVARPPMVVDVQFHEFDVYIGRQSNRARDLRCHARSRWANPFVVGKETGLKRGDACAKFRTLMEARLGIADLRLGIGPAKVGRIWPGGIEVDFAETERWRLDLLSLGGLRLGCWCRGKCGKANFGACHGDVLVELWGELKGAG